MENKEFTITKKISKHGSQAIIIIPQMLKSFLEPGTLIEVTLKILERRDEK